MSLGNIVGQLLRQGLGGQTHQRVDRATRGPMAGGLEGLLGSVLGGGANRSGSAAGGLGGLGDVLGSVLGGGARAGGGLSGGQLGGLGALAGILLGGKGSTAKNAIGGTAMALLGSMALKALQARMQSRGGPRAGFADLEPTESQIAAVTDDKAQELVLRAMLSAAKADGQVSEDELQRIVGKIDDDGITPAERQTVMDELRRPLDMAGLVAAVPNELVAAEVYAASLLAIDVDTQQEETYLRNLAQALKLDAETVARLHEMTGVRV